jgi:hypothetical protein
MEGVLDSKIHGGLSHSEVRVPRWQMQTVLDHTTLGRGEGVREKLRAVL